MDNYGQYDRERYLILKNIPKELRKVLKENRAYVAGGSITSVFSNQKINDYDIYFSELSKMNNVLNFLQENWSLEPVVSTENSETFEIFTPIENKIDIQGNPEKINIQIITRQNCIGIIKSVISLFDFTIVQAAYSFEFDHFVFINENVFLKHLIQKRLVFNIKTPFPISSLIRIKKYLDRGYSINGIELIKMALLIRDTEIDTYEDFKIAINGVDDAILKDFFENNPENEAFNTHKAIEKLDMYIGKLFEID